MAKKELNEENLGKLIDIRDMKKCLAEMEPGDRVKAYLKLMEFVVPKKQSIAQDINANVKDDAEMLVSKLAGTFTEWRQQEKSGCTNDMRAAAFLCVYKSELRFVKPVTAAESEPVVDAVVLNLPRYGHCR